MHKCYIVMGVSGSGKTTIGKLLADRLNVPFLDADDFHPPENIRKMTSGIPLNDADREPWLNILSKELDKRKEGCVLGCSALKEKYRKLLEQASATINWVYLEASPELIRHRLSQRKDHFMPSSLIDSQFEALEVPADAICVDASLHPEEIVDKIIGKSV